MIPARCWAALALAGLAAAAHADTVLRCTAPDGRLTFTNVACAPGEHAESVDVQPAALDSSGLRDWARRSPAARPLVAREASAANPRQPRQYDPIACENAQREYRYEAANHSPRRGGMGAYRDEVRRACGGG